MKTFICIVALAVATCKAGIVGHQSGGGGGGSGYEHSAPSGGQSEWAPSGHSFSQGGHDSGHGSGLDSFAQQHSFQGLSGHGDQSHTLAFAEDQGHGQGQDHSAPSYPQFQQTQEKSFDFGGHGAAGYGDSGSSQDSYLQAAQSFSHGNSDSHGAPWSSGGQGDEHGQSQGWSSGGQQGKGFVLQDAGHEFGGHGGDSNIVIENGHGQDFGQQGGDFGHQGGDFGHQGGDFGHQGGDFGHQGGDFGHQGGDFEHQEDSGHSQAFSVGGHTDVETPVKIPHYKYSTYPIHKPIHINVPKPILIGVPHPYPVKVQVHKPVAVPVETEISIPIEKPVPYPVYKNVPYPVEKHVPVKVEKTVTVHVPHPYPVKIPIYKTIHHHKKHHQW